MIHMSNNVMDVSGELGNEIQLARLNPRFEVVSQWSVIGQYMELTGFQKMLKVMDSTVKFCDRKFVDRGVGLPSC